MRRSGRPAREFPIDRATHKHVFAATIDVPVLADYFGISCQWRDGELGYLSMSAKVFAKVWASPGHLAET